MSRTAYFTHDVFLEHDTGAGHPETSRRLVAIRDRLEKTAYFSRFVPLPDRRASADEIGSVHSGDYIHSVEDYITKGGRALDPDTVVSAKSYEAATLAAGAGIAAAEAIQSGDVDRALLLVRPPGHHSLSSRAMGFCLFNNVAVCARAMQRLGYEKIAILDWDVHHGNGTEAMFYDDDSVLFVSTHQYPFYPGTGAASDAGTGKGEGFTLNVPMQSGSDDDDYKAAFENQVLPRIEEFRPDAILISAGFDGHVADPLASIRLSTEFFAYATERVLALADQLCDGRVISFLEGGYDLPALAASVEAHAAVLIG